MPWDDEKETTFRNALNGPNADALVTGLATNPVPSGPAADWARAHGLIGSDRRYFSDGYIVNDSCREFRFWSERNQALPHLGTHPALTAESLKDRRVIEIGAGAGMNVLSLQALGADATGIEPVKAYVAMGRLLAAHAGQGEPDLRQGFAESIPLNDGEADVVLCISAYNYFNIAPALTEMARILKPEGEVYLISAMFADLAHTALTHLITGPSRKQQLVLLANSLSFALVGRRVFSQKPDQPTARPVYATIHQLRRMSRAAGLEPDKRVTRTSIGHVFRATKPAAQGNKGNSLTPTP